MPRDPHGRGRHGDGPDGLPGRGLLPGRRGAPPRRPALPRPVYADEGLLREGRDGVLVPGGDRGGQRAAGPRAADEGVLRRNRGGPDDDNDRGDYYGGRHDGGPVLDLRAPGRQGVRHGGDVPDGRVLRGPGRRPVARLRRPGPHGGVLPEGGQRLLRAGGDVRGDGRGGPARGAGPGLLPPAGRDDRARHHDGGCHYYDGGCDDDRGRNDN
mmetsp:Transcript_6143/g.12950  ORF Transcript_6143/g.12950 Transcript_6143/m.12950 type:complete len:212 (+) Transcript_6143:210-845(+)